MPRAWRRLAPGWAEAARDWGEAPCWDEAAPGWGEVEGWDERVQCSGAPRCDWAAGCASALCSGALERPPLLPAAVVAGALHGRREFQRGSAREERTEEEGAAAANRPWRQRPAEAEAGESRRPQQRSRAQIFQYCACPRSTNVVEAVA